jgi:hypothetical protein
MMVGIDIDSQGIAWDHNPLATGNPQQPPKAEVAHKKNGIESERTKYDGSWSQPMVGPTQHEEVQLEDITGKPESR